MTILVSGVSGVSGHLGRLVLDRLLARGGPASGLVAGARSPRRRALRGRSAVTSMTGPHRAGPSGSRPAQRLPSRMTRATSAGSSFMGT
ncbi:uncharacterized protein YbjT (DUF2867 family) [Streptomyces albaduncus]|uniref:Uncharacterized protein YbjT (DUF2867 family) n=1 Tax=Streptomyces griseoloalbus TaxID=67303 RepID=A0A7W8BPX0_9ACTN|nr:uncharacterized protein YbjT (DUF2867 family) [Streptomyces albaduncus]